MAKETLHFWIPEYSGTFDDSFPFEVHNYRDLRSLEWIAEQYAEYYHDHRGWEDSWPITFHIAKPDGTFLGAVTVERETRPHFIGRIK